MSFKWSDLITGHSGKVSRTAVTFLLWFVFLVGMITYALVRNNGKIPEIPQAYVYLTLAFSGTYTARRYYDAKFESSVSAPSIPIPPKLP